MTTQTATILVSDLVGSTELRAALGEDRAEEVRRLHDRALIEVAERAGGIVVKGLGDGLLVQFAGAAEAVGAAVTMQQTIDTLGRREGLDLSIRVGVSSGDITVDDGDCFGVPVVEASRLCSAAGNGEIYAAEVVTVLARGRGNHVVESVGDLELKGLPDPVAVHRIGWEPTRASSDLRGVAPYVGRAEERRILRERFDAAATGAGGLVLIAGEPGIGKTRLTTELCRDVAVDAGATVLVGGCHDGDVGAYAPFVEAITDWLRSTPVAEVTRVLGTEASVLGRVAPAVHRVLTDVPELADLGPDDAEARLNDAIGQVLVRLTETRPAVLLLDDLHWADAGSIALLRVVARKSTGIRLLVIGTYRDTDLDRRHPLAEALPLLRREVEPTRVALEGLPTDAVHELLERLADHEVPMAFATLLADQTDGNPFFLREMLIHLTEVGALRFEDGVWTAAADIANAIPEGVREVVGRRLSQLSDATQKLLEIGAHFEVAFPLDVAAEVAKIDEDEALDAIDEALQAQIVLATGVFDRYAFSHALFRQTLVGELNPSRQVRTHRAIAEALEKRVAGRPSPEMAAILARHWSLSAAIPGAERGVPAALIVADDAAARFAHRDAFDAWSVALDLLPDGDEREAEIRLGRARSGLAGGIDADGVVEDARVAAAEISAVEGDDAAAAAVSELVILAWQVGDRRSAWRLGDVGRAHLDGERRDKTWARLRKAQLQQAEFADPDHGGLPLDDPDRREVQAVIEALDPEEADGLEYAPSSRAAAVAFLAKDPPLRTGVMARWVIGDLSGIVGGAEDGRAEAEREGNFELLVLINVISARGLALLGRHDEADEAMLRAGANLHRLPERSNAAFQYTGAEWLIAFVRGAMPTYTPRSLLGGIESNPDTRWVTLAVVAANAFAAAFTGSSDEALADIELALTGIELAPGHAPNYGLIACMPVHALWILDRTDHLEVIEANIRSKLVDNGLLYPEVLNELALAQVCALTGRREEAREWVTKGHTFVTAQGVQPLDVHIDSFEAEWELRLGTDGDAGRCRAAIERARAGCTDPAMAPWLPRLDALEHQAASRWA
jgi:class 3 adenylate cyclase